MYSTAPADWANAHRIKEVENYDNMESVFETIKSYNKERRAFRETVMVAEIEIKMIIKIKGISTMIPRGDNSFHFLRETQCPFFPGAYHVEGDQRRKVGGSAFDKRLNFDLFPPQMKDPMTRRFTKSNSRYNKK